MLLEIVFNLIFGVILMVINLLPKLPLPQLDFNVSEVFDYIFYGGIDLIDIFVPVDLIIILLKIVLTIEIFIRLYHLIMWVVTWIKSHKS